MALLLTTLAGLATAVGSVIAFFAHHTNYRFLSGALGFSAGVMLYVSFAEIMPLSLQELTAVHGRPVGDWLVTASFFGGILLIGLVDRLVPKPRNPHEPREESEYAQLREGSDIQLAADDRAARWKLRRTGLVTALAIGIHNFPEGMATFFASLESVQLGAMIAVAIALHNIPEGISVSVPIYYATGSRRKAFTWSAISGISEPVGAAIALAFMAWLNQPQLTGIMFAGVAGIMVFISLDELLPTARAYSTGHETVYGLVGGMAVLALSLLLLK